MNTMHAVHDDFGLSDEPRHIATCINLTDLQEMRDTFVKELTGTVVAFVYSKQKQQELKDKFVADGREESHAWTLLQKRARQKFRPSDLRGQFSELLLCNLLQHYYKAAPLLRKMSLTTNTGVERHGLDAIHIAKAGDKYRMYLGEAKTYDRKTNGLREALRASVTDLVHKHYPGHRKELDLYIFEDFVPTELEDIARGYLAGRNTDVEMHLVCIVTYDEKAQPTGMSRAEKLSSTVQIVLDQMKTIRNSDFFKKIPLELQPRMNYIIFSVRAMDELIAAFAKELGA